MFKLTTNEIKVTENARDYLRSIVGDAKGLRLRIAHGKGCSGNEYRMEPVTDANFNEKDDALEVEQGLTLFIPNVDVLKFFGSTVDFIEDDLGSKKLKITNPNETGRCGCGESIAF
ncbi:MAG: iron-sulfur cluster assembly accessory protein [Alphaproteobacteria bacterium]|nr:iron-sulfur cluster assembly accessory protein [Alphaproteobacteria bacterium]